MRAVVAKRFGDDLPLQAMDCPLPVPSENEVLLRVQAAAVCRADVYLLAGKPYMMRLGYGLRAPRHTIPGQSLSGVVLACGKVVQHFHPGDEVFGEIPGGAFADFAAAPAHLLAHKPATLSHAEAAALALPGLTALQGLRDVGALRAGEHLLINGASGSVGSLAIQIGKALGARVTVVCRGLHGQRLRALGADEVIDYRHESFTARLSTFDLIFDLVANHAPCELARCLAPGGRCVAAAIPAGKNLVGPLTWFARLALADAFSGKRFHALLAQVRQADLQTLASMAADGRIRPVIERRYDFAHITDAYNRVASGHAQGATVVTLGGQR